MFVETEGAKHEWTDIEEVPPAFEHPLWERLEREARGAGHGGMDFLEDYRLIECLRRESRWTWTSTTARRGAS